MSYGRFDTKIEPMGFDAAATELTLEHGLSPEAASGLVRMVKDVAVRVPHNDGAALSVLRGRLGRVAESPAKGEWAREVIGAARRATLQRRTPYVPCP